MDPDACAPRPGGSAACDRALQIIDEVLVANGIVPGSTGPGTLPASVKVALAHRFGQELRQARAMGGTEDAERFVLVRVQEMIEDMKRLYSPTRTAYAKAVVQCCEGLIEQIRNMKSDPGSGGCSELLVGGTLVVRPPLRPDSKNEGKAQLGHIWHVRDGLEHFHETLAEAEKCEKDFLAREKKP